MGARDYVAQRSSQIDHGKVEVLKAIRNVHVVQREVLRLRQVAQVERMLESDASLAYAMEENITMLTGLETAFGAVVDSIEKLPTSFEAVDGAEKRLEAALPSTSPPSPPSSS